MELIKHSGITTIKHGVNLPDVNSKISCWTVQQGKENARIFILAVRCFDYHGVRAWNLINIDTVTKSKLHHTKFVR